MVSTVSDPGACSPRATELANSTTGPWEKSNWNQEQLFAFLAARRPTENAALWAAPFKFTEASDHISAEGFLYIPNPPAAQGPSNVSVARAELFCRHGIRVKRAPGTVEKILPEYANGLVMLDGERRMKEATKLYEQAANSKPMDATERLDVELAKAELQD